MGLREQILAATSVEAIGTLLKEGEAYTYASVRTRNAWFHAANRKRVEFGQTAEVRKQEKKAEKVSKKTSKQKKHGQK